MAAGPMEEEPCGALPLRAGGGDGVSAAEAEVRAAEAPAGEGAPEDWV